MFSSGCGLATRSYYLERQKRRHIVLALEVRRGCARPLFSARARQQPHPAPNAKLEARMANGALGALHYDAS